ncbi:MAG: hypothetical protein R3A10_00830 [Caldilineaceae bacterium]
MTGLQSIAIQTWARYLAPGASVFTVFSDDPDTALIGDPTVSALFTTEAPVVSCRCCGQSGDWARRHHKVWTAATSAPRLVQ